MADTQQGPSPDPKSSVFVCIYGSSLRGMQSYGEMLAIRDRCIAAGQDYVLIPPPREIMGPDGKRTYERDKEGNPVPDIDLYTISPSYIKTVLDQNFSTGGPYEGRPYVAAIDIHGDNMFLGNRVGHMLNVRSPQQFSAESLYEVLLNSGKCEGVLDNSCYSGASLVDMAEAIKNYHLAHPQSGRSLEFVAAARYNETSSQLDGKSFYDQLASLAEHGQPFSMQQLKNLQFATQNSVKQEGDRLAAFGEKPSHNVGLISLALGGQHIQNNGDVPGVAHRFDFNQPIPEDLTIPYHDNEQSLRGFFEATKSGRLHPSSLPIPSELTGVVSTQEYRWITQAIDKAGTFEEFAEDISLKGIYGKASAIGSHWVKPGDNAQLTLQALTSTDLSFFSDLAHIDHARADPGIIRGTVAYQAEKYPSICLKKANIWLPYFNGYSPQARDIIVNAAVTNDEDAIRAVHAWLPAFQDAPEKLHELVVKFGSKFPERKGQLIREIQAEIEKNSNQYKDLNNIDLSKVVPPENIDQLEARTLSLSDLGELTANRRPNPEMPARPNSGISFS